MKAWGILIASGAVLLTTSAWAQEQPRLGFKDIHLGMPKAELRAHQEEACRWTTKYLTVEGEFTKQRVPASDKHVAACLRKPRNELAGEQYQHVGSIEIKKAMVDLVEDRVGEIRLIFYRGQFGLMEAALTTKYGPPTSRRADVFQNGLGARFTRAVVTWVLPDGVLAMRERGPEVDWDDIESEAVMRSLAYLESLVKANKEEIKRDAEGL